jgi:hypothetical protein
MIKRKPSCSSLATRLFDLLEGDLPKLGIDRKQPLGKSQSAKYHPHELQDISFASALKPVTAMPTRMMNRLTPISMVSRVCITTEGFCTGLA